MFSAQNSQVSNNVNYVEDVFSTYLYTGNSSTQTITNNIDLAGKGGLVWMKNRDTTGYSNMLIDTVRGATKQISSDQTAAQSNVIYGLTAFNSSGFNLNFDSEYNQSSKTYVSWTFREQPKFFDVVTYTGNNAAQTIAHNLASTPGCVIIKCTNVGGTSWWVRHRSVPGNAALLNSSSGFAFNINDMPSVSDTSLIFSSGTSTNNSGETYVAYLFAHNAGGFGLTGTDNVVSCGSFTTDGTGAAGDITLGYESQWVMFKRTDGVGNWQIVDTMRGSSLTSYNYISPTVSNAESSSTSTQGIYPTATGFYVGNNFPGANQTYVYIAIRRGPMKVPTLGTSVFKPITRAGTGTTANITGVGFSADLVLSNNRTSAFGNLTADRLRGSTIRLITNASNAEDVQATTIISLNMDGITVGTDATGSINYAAGGDTYITYFFRRSPGFFDEVCYTGTGVARTVTHNLTVDPELMIVKSRSNSGQFWATYSATTGSNKFLQLNATDAAGTLSSVWNNTAPTSSVFTVGTRDETNGSTFTYVAYLFATCPGVSKVGSYTGTGALQTVACGFTSGARFVLIKRTDSTGDWYVWDSARGITSGNDPYLLLNSTAAEVTSTNYVDTDSTGFKVTAAAPAALNASGGTYIFLAIA